MEKNKQNKVVSVESRENKKNGAESSVSVITYKGEKLEYKKPKEKRGIAKKILIHKGYVAKSKRKSGMNILSPVLAVLVITCLFAFLVLNQMRLEECENKLASMNSELLKLEYAEDELEYKLAKKEDATLIKEYAESIGMVDGSEKQPVYVEMQLENETTVIEAEEKESGWTSLLSSMGKLFSEILG